MYVLADPLYVLIVLLRDFRLIVLDVRTLDVFFFSSRRRHTRYIGDWSSDVCSSDLSPIANSLVSPTFIDKTLFACLKLVASPEFTVIVLDRKSVV